MQSLLENRASFRPVLMVFDSWVVGHIQPQLTSMSVNSSCSCKIPIFGSFLENKEKVFSDHDANDPKLPKILLHSDNDDVPNHP